MNAQANRLDSLKSQDALVNSLTTRIQDLLTFSNPPSLVQSANTTAFVSSQTFPSTFPSHGTFLEDLRSTIQPLVHAPLDLDHLVAKIVSQINLEQLAASQLSDASSSSLTELISAITQSRNETSTSLEHLSSKVSTILDYQSQLAKTLSGSQDAASTLKDNMAQLGLDVTSRLDSAYSALEQRPANDSASQYAAKVATLEFQ